MNKIKPMAADEQAVLSYSLKGKVASVVFSVKENDDKGTPRCNLTWHFDYSDVTPEEIMLQAVRQQKIDGSRLWRPAKDRMDADVWQGKTWSVRAMLDQTRQKKSDVDKADDALGKLSEAEIAKAFAKYGLK